MAHYKNNIPVLFDIYDEAEHIREVRHVFDGCIDMGGLPDSYLGVTVVTSQKPSKERKDYSETEWQQFLNDNYNNGIKDAGRTFHEIYEHRTPSALEFRIDYKHGWLYLNPTIYNDQYIILDYYSRGVELTPASRIYTFDANGCIDLKTTLQTYIDEVNEGCVFTPAKDFENIKSREHFSTMFGKLARWYTEICNKADRGAVQSIQLDSMLEGGIYHMWDSQLAYYKTADSVTASASIDMLFVVSIPGGYLVKQLAVCNCSTNDPIILTRAGTRKDAIDENKGCDWQEWKRIDHDLLQKDADILKLIGTLSSLNTSVKTDLVSAINSEISARQSNDTTLSTRIDNEATARANADSAEATARAAADGEIEDKLKAHTMGTDGRHNAKDVDYDEVDGDSITVKEALDKLFNTDGKLSDLNTDDKSNLVAAINEVLRKYFDLNLEDRGLGLNWNDYEIAHLAEGGRDGEDYRYLTDVGILGSLTTAHKENIVAAINELVSEMSDSGADLGNKAAKGVVTADTMNGTLEPGIYYVNNGGSPLGSVDATPCVLVVANSESTGGNGKCYQVYFCIGNGSDPDVICWRLWEKMKWSDYTEIPIGGASQTDLSNKADYVTNNGFAAGGENLPGDYCVTIGAGAETNDHSVAVGDQADANFSENVAIGSKAKASSEGSTAVGANSFAGDHYSDSLDYKNSTTIGHSATARGENATAIGTDSAADYNGVAIGYNAQAVLDAAQIGTGSNPTENTLQFQNYRVVDSDGGVKFLGDVGKLSGLTTNAKSNIVAAINELNNKQTTNTAKTSVAYFDDQDEDSFVLASWNMSGHIAGDDYEIEFASTPKIKVRDDVFGEFTIPAQGEVTCRMPLPAKIGDVYDPSNEVIFAGYIYLRFVLNHNCGTSTSDSEPKITLDSVQCVLRPDGDDISYLEVDGNKITALNICVTEAWVKTQVNMGVQLPGQAAKPSTVAGYTLERVTENYRAPVNLQRHGALGKHTHQIEDIEGLSEALQNSGKESYFSIATVDGSILEMTYPFIEETTGEYSLDFKVPQITVKDSVFGEITLPAQNSISFSGNAQIGGARQEYYYAKYLINNNFDQGRISLSYGSVLGVTKPSGQPVSYIEIKGGNTLSAVYIYLGCSETSGEATGHDGGGPLYTGECWWNEKTEFPLLHYSASSSSSDTDLSNIERRLAELEDAVVRANDTVLIDCGV